MTTMASGEMWSTVVSIFYINKDNVRSGITYNEVELTHDGQSTQDRHAPWAWRNRKSQDKTHMLDTPSDRMQMVRIDAVMDAVRHRYSTCGTPGRQRATIMRLHVYGVT